MNTDDPFKKDITNYSWIEYCIYIANYYVQSLDCVEIMELVLVNLQIERVLIANY